jgi:hypothetical protein
LIYAAMNFVFVPIVWYFYVETATLSLEEIDTMFETLFKQVEHGSTGDSLNEKDVVVIEKEFKGIDKV